MSDDGGECGKAQAVVHEEGSGKENGGVAAILLSIEEAVRNDLGNVVRGTGICEGLRGVDRQEGGVPSVGEVDDWDDEPVPEQERNHGVRLSPPLENRLDQESSLGCE